MSEPLNLKFTAPAAQNENPVPAVMCGTCETGFGEMWGQYKDGRECRLCIVCWNRDVASRMLSEKGRRRG